LHERACHELHKLGSLDSVRFAGGVLDDFPGVVSRLEHEHVVVELPRVHRAEVFASADDEELALVLLVGAADSPAGHGFGLVSREYDGGPDQGVEVEGVEVREDVRADSSAEEERAAVLVSAPDEHASGARRREEAVDVEALQRALEDFLRGDDCFWFGQAADRLIRGELLGDLAGLAQEKALELGDLGGVLLEDPAHLVRVLDLLGETRVQACDVRAQAGLVLLEVLQRVLQLVFDELFGEGQLRQACLVGCRVFRVASGQVFGVGDFGGQRGEDVGELRLREGRLGL